MTALNTAVSQYDITVLFWVMHTLTLQFSIVYEKISFIYSCEIKNNLAILLYRWH